LCNAVNFPCKDAHHVWFPPTNSCSEVIVHQKNKSANGSDMQAVFKRRCMNTCTAKYKRNIWFTTSSHNYMHVTTFLAENFCTINLANNFISVLLFSATVGLTSGMATSTACKKILFHQCLKFFLYRLCGTWRNL